MFFSYATTHVAVANESEHNLTKKLFSAIDNAFALHCEPKNCIRTLFLQVGRRFISAKNEKDLETLIEIINYGIIEKKQKNKWFLFPQKNECTLSCLCHSIKEEYCPVMYRFMGILDTKEESPPFIYRLMGIFQKINGLCLH
jgi:hypothetical protein